MRNKADMAKVNAKLSFLAASTQNQTLLGQGVCDDLSQPMSSSTPVNNTMKSPPPSKSLDVTPPITRQSTPRPSVTQDVTVEKFSGLRLRYVFLLFYYKPNIIYFL